MAEIAVVTAKSVWKVFKVVYAINKAVETDRRNHKEFEDIMSCANRVEFVLKNLHGRRELAVRPVLDDLARSLNKALELIQRCQGRNTIYRFYKAGDTAKELSRVKDEIEHHLLMAVFASTMHIFTLPNTTLQPHQIAMISIMVDLECCRCKMKMEKILFMIREKEMMMQAKISFDTSNNMVIIAGWFDVRLLTEKIVCKAGRVIKDIKIMEDEEEAQEHGTVDETRKLAQDERPATREEDDGHIAKASEWPGDKTAALPDGCEVSTAAQQDGCEGSHQRLFRLQVQVPLGRRTPGHGTNPATTMIQGTPKVTKYPSPSSKRVAQKRPPWR